MAVRIEEAYVLTRLGFGEEGGANRGQPLLVHGQAVVFHPDDEKIARGFPGGFAGGSLGGPPEGAPPAAMRIVPWPSLFRIP